MNFDETVDRRDTNCAKWDGAARYAGTSQDDLLPMWIADTDFRTPPVARKALADMAEFGVFGYMAGLDAMRDSVTWWMKARHDWDVDPAHILCAGGLGNAIAAVIDAMTEPGDEIMIFTPVYHEFANRITNAGRTVIQLQMRESDDRVAPDLEAASRAVTDKTRMILFCSPHNPGGQVWTLDEMRQVASFCSEHDLLLVSDEIHHDIVYPGHRFEPMARLTDIADRLIVLTAPSKTFNLAGLRLGHIIIADEALRARMNASLSARCIQPNSAGATACTAVYSEEGAAWADAQIEYLEQNRAILDTGMNAIPGVNSRPLQATFLSWVDFTGTGMSEDEIIDRLTNRARVVPQRGSGFGPGGPGYMRFNIGTQRALVEEAVARVQDAFSDLQ